MPGWSAGRVPVRMTLEMRARLYLLAIAGAAAAGAAVWLATQVPPDRPTEPGPVLTLLVGASLLGCGLASWHARPENRLGPIMVADRIRLVRGAAERGAQLASCTRSASRSSTCSSSGFIYILLSFPSGRLEVDLVPVAGVVLAAAERRPAARGDAVRQRHRAAVRRRVRTTCLQVFHHNTLAMNLLDVQRLLGGDP